MNLIFILLFFRFKGNDFLCRSVKYFQVVAMYASSYVLVSTAIDRYLAICHPLTAQVTMVTYAGPPSPPPPPTSPPCSHPLILFPSCLPGSCPSALVGIHGDRPIFSDLSPTHCLGSGNFKKCNLVNIM